MIPLLFGYRSMSTFLQIMFLDFYIFNSIEGKRFKNVKFNH